MQRPRVPPQRQSPRPVIAAFAVALLLTACQKTDLAASDTPLTLEAPRAEPVDFTDKGPTETYRLGLEYFKRGEYGLAEASFRATVEKDSANVEAWIGLAGSYDNIRRFDLADRAYAAAIRLKGETVQILNNQGQSYMLRSDFKTARLKLRKALRLDPHNATVINNLRLLDANEPKRR
jgi:Flp pilus assembly protein TadD